MLQDDGPIGRLLTRREVLELFGMASMSFLLGCTFPNDVDSHLPTPTDTPSTTACVVRPELTEGPYFVDEDLHRSDVRTDPVDGTRKEGVTLALTFRVMRMGEACEPLPGARLDIWQCDALGIYSDVSDPNFDTTGKKFLRGYQITDDRGVARFTTIYPGWYSGRAVHIHFKIRYPRSGSQTYDFTSQLFFDEDITDRVHSTQPYASKGPRDTRNSQDLIYRQGGDQLLLVPASVGRSYSASIALALDLS